MNQIKLIFQKKWARKFYQILRPLQPILNLKKRTFFDKFNVKTIDGKNFWLYNNAFQLETDLFWAGFEEFEWENKTREIWSKLSEHLSVILDIGANTGIFSVLAKTYNDEAVVHAFEPQPNVFKVLEINKEINDFDIHCHQIALSHKSGSMPFFNSGFSTFENNNTTHGSLNKDWRTKNQASIKVQVQRLDEFIKVNQIDTIDLIKIDVETFEYEVLKGYGKFLKAHKPIIILEIQDRIIGKNIQSLFNEDETFFYWINEKKGLIPTHELGDMTNQENLNYLICPSEKKSFIEHFIS